MTIDWSNPIVQGAIVAGAISIGGVIVAALAGFGGAVLGAGIAAGAAEKAATLASSEAQEDRVEARRARLAERSLELGSTVLARSERHKHEVGVQFGAWLRAADQQLNPDGVIPEVGPIDDVLDAVGGLYIVANQATANAAWDLYTASRDGLDRWVYVAERDRHGDLVGAPTLDHIEAIDTALIAFDVRKTMFLNAIRVELGLDPLVGVTPPFPDSDEDT